MLSCRQVFFPDYRTPVLQSGRKIGLPTSDRTFSLLDEDVANDALAPFSFVFLFSLFCFVLFYFVLLVLFA